ncbi:low-density lipoprotein receptor-related protein 4-like [Mytilus trossulus]|uniref:low-density lipoprotein receptor-related protein 4-like n=1 Tax=Mytilus trossulus TaxID=6551 RepID=UPI0030063E11
MLAPKEEKEKFEYPSKNVTIQKVVRSFGSPSGLAVDSTNEHLYWVDDDGHRLVRSNLDGSNVTVLSKLSNPFVIRLDLTNRWVYIVQNYLGISKSSIDLNHELRRIVNFTSTYVACMDIDTDEQRLYWIDNNGDILSAVDDGSDVKPILSTHHRRTHYAMGVVGSHIYYATDSQLLVVPKLQGSTPILLYNDTSRIDSIFVFNVQGISLVIYNHLL